MKLLLPPSSDGVYPCCVHCGGENYAMAVSDYSKGIIPCASARGCGEYLPKEYIKLK